MSRKVFISFLGTGNYKQCVYSYNQESSSVLKFVQEALIQLIIPTLGENHQCYFFLTEKAHNEHYEELATILKKYPDLIYEVVDGIPDGVTENQIWEIFEIVFSKIHKNDILYLDITHGFRSLPMLALTLINYAKTMKDIQVGGIYYGAFEVLGPGYDIDQRIPDPSERIVPILNLIPFSEIQDWAQAGNNFFKLGNSESIVELAKQGLANTELTQRQRNKLNEKLRIFALKFSAFSLSFSTCRGGLIIDSSHVVELEESISNILNDLKGIPSYAPLIDILQRICNRLNNYKKGSLENLYEAVKWCLESKQIQPAATLLQEGFISILLDKFDLDINDKVFRGTINGFLNKAKNEAFRFDNEDLNKRQKQQLVIKYLEDLEGFSELSKKFRLFTNDYRNDINHASFGRKGISPLDFENPVRDFFTFVQSTFPCS